MAGLIALTQGTGDYISSRNVQAGRKYNTSQYTIQAGRVMIRDEKKMITFTLETTSGALPFQSLCLVGDIPRKGVPINQPGDAAHRSYAKPKTF
jgi:hypothetical protein